MKTFPDDDDGAVLRRLQERGVDLDRPRNVDFYCWVKDHHTAGRIIMLLNGMGFSSQVSGDDEAEPEDTTISVYSTINMVPDYDDLIRTQIELNEVLAPFGTHCDGWGTLVDPEETKQG